MLNQLFGQICLFIVAYFIGSFPTGIIYGRMFFNKDVRNYGSGGSGATNIGRNFGFKAAAVVAIGDVLKGFIPVLLARIFYPDQHLLIMLVTGAAVVGHAYPIFANFKGGKIIATSIGAFLAIEPIIAVATVVILFSVIFLTSYVSLASLTSYGLITLYILFTSPYWEYRIGFVCLYLFAIYRHRENIQRLRQGNEKYIRWGFKYLKNRSKDN